MITTISICRTLSSARALVGLLCVGLASGCAQNAGQGAATGAGIGALTGLTIAAATGGSTGTGMAVGAGVGAAGGAIHGDRNRQRREAANTPPARVPTPAPNAGSTPPASVPATPAMTQADRDRLALAQLARTWRVTGWETVDGQRRLVSGTATGSVEYNFFVRLDMSTRDEQTGRVNTGDIVFASEPGRGLTMNSRFDTSPSPLTFEGAVTDDGRVFTLDEIAPRRGNTGRRVVIRFLSSDEWVADVTDRSGGRSTPQASFSFSGGR